MPAGFIHIIKPGMITTVQDLGRNGYQQFGMPVCGAMDSWSHRLANLLVGNPTGAACLEATMAGPEICFEGKTRFAVCGADMNPHLNGTTIKNFQTYQANKGDVLSLGYAVKGSRSYIASSGGIAVPMVMGSRSTYLTGKTGGWHGRALMAGDSIPLGEDLLKQSIETIPAEIANIPFLPGPIRILPGPETNCLDLQALKTLLNSTFTISHNSNRMGYRLEGAAVIPKPGSSNIVSAPVPIGTIQAPANGEPIVLMADRQTTGGYPRVGVVATADLPRLAQLKPGDKLTFEEISLEKARQMIKNNENLLKSLTC